MGGGRECVPPHFAAKVKNGPVPRPAMMMDNSPQASSKALSIPPHRTEFDNSLVVSAPPAML